LNRLVSSVKYIEDNGYQRFYRINVNSENVFEVYEGGDNNLGWNFNDVYLIPTLMQIAYHAGKNGEEFKISNAESDK
jgi:hypothetical protein